MWNALVEAIKAIQGWLALNRNNKNVQNQELLDALIELHRAANLTRAYLAEVAINGQEGEAQTRGAVFPRDIRDRLSQGWLEVGRKLSGCNYKYHDGHIHD